MVNIFSKSFWQPEAGKTRIRDVLRELPGGFQKTVAEGTTKFGQAIGGAIAAPSVAKQLAEAEAKQLETNQIIFQKMRENKAQGKSNGNLINYLKTQNKMTSPTLEDIVPAAKMTTGQIAGAALGTAVETLGFGTAFKSVKSMRAAALAASEGIGPTSIAGIAKATGKELLKNVPFGYGADVSRRLMAGETGPAAFKPGLGTAITAALPIAGGAERAFRLSRANDVAKLQRFGFTVDEAKKVAPTVGLPDTPALNKIGEKMGKLADEINSSTDINFVQKGEAQLQNLKNQFRQTLTGELQAGKIQIGRGAEEVPIPTTPPLKETAGNIRLDKFAVSDEGKKLLRTIIDENQGFMKQRRGVVSMEETQALADQLIPKTRLKKGTALNAQELQALGDTVTSLTRKADDFSQKILAGDNSDKNLLDFAKAKTELTFATASYAGATSEAGRSLQIIKKLNEALMSNDAKLIKQALKLSGDRNVIEDILSKLALMGDNDLAKIKFLRASSNATTADKVYEVWMNSILAGPATQMANIAGNTINSLLRIPTKAVQAGLSKDVYLREVPESIIGGYLGLKDGVRKANFIFKNGLSMEQASKIEIGRAPAIKGTVGEIIRTPTKLLSMADEFMKAIVGSSEMRALAYRQARQEGLKGQSALQRMYEIIDTPSPELLDAVEKATLDATFQTPLGKAGNWLIEGRNKVPGLKYIIPFVKTMVNIGKESVRLTPAGYAVAGVKKLRGGYANLPPNKFSEDAAKATIGSIMAIPIVMGAREGTITGAAPKNKNEREAFYRQGKQPYAIKVGDKWYSYRRLEPLATVIGLTADISTIKADKGIADSAGQVISIIARNFNDKTFMSGLSNFVDAITDDSKREKWVLNTLGGFQPYSALTRYGAQLIDPTVREPQNIKEKFMSQIPGLSQMVPAKLDVWGQPVQRTLSQRLTPIGITQEINDQVEQALKELGISPGLPSKTIMGQELTQKEQDKYTATSGKVTKQVLDELVKSPEWQKMTARERELSVNRTINTVRDKVRNQLFPIKNMAGDIKARLKDSGYTDEQAAELTAKVIKYMESKQ